MTTFRETLKKPSVAIQAMIDGMHEASEDPLFEFNMFSFGHIVSDGTKAFCYGCAATCAIQKVTHVKLIECPTRMPGEDLQRWRAKVWDVDTGDLVVFESAIDMFRRGYPYELFEYFHVEEHFNPKWNKLFYVYSQHWEEELVKVEALLEELKGMGL